MEKIRIVSCQIMLGLELKERCTFFRKAAGASFTDWWDEFKNKHNQEINNGYRQVLLEELQALCEAIESEINDES